MEVGAVEKAVEIAKMVKEAGFYLNMAVFPAVPHGRAGLRIAVTLHHRVEDIERLVQALAVAFFSLLKQRASTATQPSA